MWKELSDDEKIALIKRDIEQVEAKQAAFEKQQNKTFLFMTPSEIFAYGEANARYDSLILQRLEDEVALLSEEYRKDDWPVNGTLLEIIRKGLSQGGQSVQSAG